MRPERHTFLFFEGLWRASGHYFDERGRAVACRGELRISHRPGRWVNDGVMQLLAPTPVEFENRYEVTPFEPGRDCTDWISINPALGRLEGRLVIVDDVIFAAWRSGDGRYHGGECLWHQDPGLYLSRGYVFQEALKMSSWAVRLEMVR